MRSLTIDLNKSTCIKLGIRDNEDDDEKSWKRTAGWKDWNMQGTGECADRTDKAVYLGKTHWLFRGKWEVNE